ncbi:MAG TPA: hypothetical protein VMH36_07440 [Alphaproteobacteria bacterium]|nr:hypothetical protein [Alphaproteobacteria bacterium]
MLPELEIAPPEAPAAIRPRLVKVPMVPLLRIRVCALRLLVIVPLLVSAPMLPLLLIAQPLALLVMVPLLVSVPMMPLLLIPAPVPLVELTLALTMPLLLIKPMVAVLETLTPVVAALILPPLKTVNVPLPVPVAFTPMAGALIVPVLVTVKLPADQFCCAAVEFDMVVSARALRANDDATAIASTDVPASKILADGPIPQPPRSHARADGARPRSLAIPARLS